MDAAGAGYLASHGCVTLGRSSTLSPDAAAPGRRRRVPKDMVCDSRRRRCSGTQNLTDESEPDTGQEPEREWRDERT